jgi:DNA-binding transcriptional ArsR family regulator
MSIAPVEVFAALGDPTRQELLSLLGRQQAATAAMLAAPLAVTRQAVEKHLKVLDRAGLVDSRHVGRRVHYAVRPEALRRSAAWLNEVAAGWDRQLAMVKVAAEQAGQTEQATRRPVAPGD